MDLFPFFLPESTHGTTRVHLNKTRWACEKVFQYSINQVFSAISMSLKTLTTCKTMNITKQKNCWERRGKVGVYSMYDARGEK